MQLYTYFRKNSRRLLNNINYFVAVCVGIKSIVYDLSKNRGCLESVNPYRKYAEEFT